METKARTTNRWSRDPICDDNGKPIIIAQPSARDIEVFSLLGPDGYRYLPKSYIDAFKGGNRVWNAKRLRALTSKPNYYLIRDPNQRPYIGNYRDQLYSLDERGTEALRRAGRLFGDLPNLTDRQQLVHQVAIDTTFASMELGARAEGVSIFSPRQIVEYEKFPAWVRATKYPLSIPVKVQHRFEKTGEMHYAEFSYTNDGMRGYRFGDADGRRYRFYQLEVEHTNRVEPQKHLNQTSFLKKYLAIRYIMENRLYRERWGIPNLTTLVVTPHQERIETMRHMILRLTGGKDCDYILFRTIPFLDDMDAPLKPMPGLWTEPWETAGGRQVLINRT